MRVSTYESMQTMVQDTPARRDEDAPLHTSHGVGMKSTVLLDGLNSTFMTSEEGDV
jgi:hypothetical protein